MRICHLSGTVKSQQMAQPVKQWECFTVVLHLEAPSHPLWQKFTISPERVKQLNRWLMITEDLTRNIKLRSSTLSPSCLLPLSTNTQLIEFRGPMATSCLFLAQQSLSSFKQHTGTHTFEKLCGYIFVSQIFTYMYRLPWFKGCYYEKFIIAKNKNKNHLQD